MEQYNIYNPYILRPFCNHIFKSDKTKFKRYEHLIFTLLFSSVDYVKRTCDYVLFRDTYGDLIRECIGKKVKPTIIFVEESYVWNERLWPPHSIEIGLRDIMLEYDNKIVKRVLPPNFHRNTSLETNRDQLLKIIDVCKEKQRLLLIARKDSNTLFYQDILPLDIFKIIMLDSCNIFETIRISDIYAKIINMR